MTAPTADPVAARSPQLTRFFTGVMRRQIRRSFRALRVARPGLPALPPGASVIVYANHPSWWDPAVCCVLADALFPGIASFGPMDAAALERYGFMRRIGIFGITQGSYSGAAQFLRAGRLVLSDKRRMLWITAQGRFVDPRERPVALQRGIAHLMCSVPGVVAVPLALEYPFWSEKRPEALACFGTPVASEGRDPAALSAELARALQAAQDRLSQDSMARDPEAFDRLLGGRAGVGGLYGGWQTLRAALRGRAPVSDHLPDAERLP